MPISKKKGLAIFALLFLCAGFIFLVRLHHFPEVPNPNIATYSVFGHGLLEGRELYSDIWEHKPPGVYLSYAAAEAITGSLDRSIFLLNIVLGTATLLGVFWAGSALGFGAWGGAFAALFWALLSNDDGVGAFSPETEAFINALMIWIFALFARAHGKKEFETWRWVTIGVLCAWASMYKHQIILSVALLSGVHLLYPEKGGLKRQAKLKQILLSAAILGAAWAGLFGYYAATGRHKLLYATLFVFNRWYKGRLIPNLIALFQPPYIFWGFKFTRLLAALAAIGIAMKGPSRAWAFALAVVVAKTLEVLVPGHLCAMHYQIWLPFLAVGAGWGISQWMHAHKKTALFAGLGSLAAIACWEAPSMLLDQPDFAEFSAGHLSTEGKRVGEELGALLKPGETFYVWGGIAELYYYSHCRFPAGPMWEFGLRQGPMKKILSDRVIEQLKQTQPSLFVVYQGAIDPVEAAAGIPNHPVVNWLLPRYVPYNPLPPGLKSDLFSYYVRKGSRLDLSNGGPR